MNMAIICLYGGIMKGHFRRALSAIGAFSIVLVGLCAYAADSSILDYLPAIVKANTTINPIGTWTGAGYSGSRSTDGSNNQICNVDSISITVTASSTTGIYLVSYEIPNFCMGTWSMTNIPALLAGSRLVFNFPNFADVGSPGSTTRMTMDTIGELVISGNTASFVLRTNGTSISPEKGFGWIIGGTVNRQ